MYFTYFPSEFFYLYKALHIVSNLALLVVHTMPAISKNMPLIKAVCFKGSKTKDEIYAGKIANRIFLEQNMAI